MNKHFRSYLFWAAAFGLGVLGLSACGGGGGSSSSETEDTPTPSTMTPDVTIPPADVVETAFSFQSMFMNLADNVIIPNYEAFDAAVASFASETGTLGAYCASLGVASSGEVMDNLSAAQGEWREVMALWQRAEVHNLGPAADDASFLRNRIYAYDSNPLDTCLTDRVVVLAEEADFDINVRPVSARGLDTVEYLLFNGDLTHSCTVPNDQTDPWNARPEVERRQARCSYALEVAADVGRAATAIHTAWLPAGENFRETFIGSEDTSDVILSTVSDAMFYIEQDSKDGKLGIPLGINAGCTALACPESVESPFSNNALQNLRANMESFVDLYTGREGMSFDDIISEAGMPSINTAFAEDANSIVSLIGTMIAEDASVQNQAQDIVDSVAGSDTDACLASSTNPATDLTVSACALYGLFSTQNDRLRTDFITVVGVDLPNRVQGDSD